ncbi:plasmid replication protein RepC [Oceaniovalibus sp. ACAM 378]|uniref:plasmid replication protein RepC n=1 Tax=Oceaniovalibus sp. ACAM 378 TaxID=2599923 RepID=UPI0011D37EAE|nr:plasmid replication protein RepC [Oceaniovalibus sp. ACAM 378]TYB85209.1 replication initiator RepC [Oceaniovalibus sp. ACAM 378]
MTSTTLSQGSGLAQPCRSAATVDKWDILSALTQAATDFGLSHRTLGVLKALMTFHPSREISARPHEAIVFPANRTLSERLNGMPESTLRRHLAQLVKLGVVDRRDSPNQKRFARRIGQKVALAFGFDLSPLARAAEQIVQAAAERRLRAEEISVMRQTVIELRQTIIDQHGPDSLTETTRLMLRRKTSLTDLKNIANTLRGQLATATAPVALDGMSGSDDQNERHIHIDSKYNSDSEVHSRRISLHDVTVTIAEYRSYFPQPVRKWEDLHDIASRVAPMIGIDQPVMISAQRALGHDAASVAILCILERLGEIGCPGAYLRHLTRQGKDGGFDARPMLAAINVRRRGKLSADNRGQGSFVAY